MSVTVATSVTVTAIFDKSIQGGVNPMDVCVPRNACAHFDRTAAPAVGRPVALLVALASLWLPGCASFGPNTLAGGRGLYNEVINATEDEQTLNMIVRDRYAETFGMLAVTNVTASVRAAAHLTADAAIGNSENYAGNLVPLQAGVAYEDNPTISYEPIGGETFLQRMLHPISLDQLVLIARASPDLKLALRTLIRSVNGLRNPLANREAPSPHFERFLGLFSELQGAQVLDVVRTEGEEAAYFINLHSYRDRHLAEVRELLGILGVKTHRADGESILLPVRLSIGRASEDAVDLETRSVFEVIRIVGGAMDIPATHLAAGIVEEYRAAPGQREPFIRVRSARQKPANATVSVFFRDWWFYIDATDTRSKQGFVLLRTLIGMQMEDSGSGEGGPVLTIPVGG